MSSTVKVGVFVSLCLAVLAYLVLKVEDISLFGGEPTRVEAEFESVAGLNDKAPVRVAGVRIGRVDGIELRDGRAVVTLLLEQDVQLGKGSRATIANAGLLGDKYIELVPGPPGAPSLPPGSVLPGSAPPSFDEALSQLSNLGGSLSELTGELVEQDTASHLAGLVRNLEAASIELRALLAANRAQVDATIGNFERFSGTLADEMPRISEQIRGLISEVDAVVRENRGDLRGSLSSIRELSERLETSVDNLNSISGQIASGEGTLGKLIYDDTAHDTLVSTLGSVEEGVSQLSETLGKVRDIEFHLGLEGVYYDDREDSRTAIGLRLQPPNDRFYQVELVDDANGRVRTRTDRITTTLPDGTVETTLVERVTEEDRFTLSAQFGFHFDAADLRVGLFESAGGAAIDYHMLRRRLTLSLEAFDFSRQDDLDPHLRFTTRYHLNPNFYLLGGYDDFLLDKGDSLFVGAGVSWQDDDLKYLLGSVPSF